MMLIFFDTTVVLLFRYRVSYFPITFTTVFKRTRRWASINECHTSLYCGVASENGCPNPHILETSGRFVSNTSCRSEHRLFTRADHSQFQIQSISGYGLDILSHLLCVCVAVM